MAGRLGGHLEVGSGWLEGRRDSFGSVRAQSGTSYLISDFERTVGCVDGVESAQRSH